MTQPERDDALPPELILDEPPIAEDELFQRSHGNDEGQEPIQLGSWEEVEWAFRRLARSRGVLDRAAARYGEMVGRIDEWYEGETSADKATVKYLEGLIERFGHAQRERDPKGPATFTFPSGSVRTSYRKDDRIDIADEKEVIAWLLAQDGITPEERAAIIAQTLSVRVTDLRNILLIREEPDGTKRVVVRGDSDELVPGVFVNPPEVKVTNIELTNTNQEESL